MLNSIKSRTAGRFLVFTFFALLNCGLFAQTPDPYKFFPSAVGNVWEYSNGLRTEILRDSMAEDGSKFLFYPNYAPPLFKIDTSYNVFWDPIGGVFGSPLNWHYYKLDADSGEHWMVRPETLDIQRIEALVEAKYSSIFLGRETIIMEITYYELNWGDTIINQSAWPRFSKYLAHGIGEVMSINHEGGGPVILIGCIIDGDTIGIITFVEDDFISVNSFQLFQNFPNPFNPTTTIKFSLAEPQKVKLIVYSLLGEEVRILADDYKSAGNYSVIFNASGLASGVYIYTLITGNQSTSKKLILLK